MKNSKDKSIIKLILVFIAYFVISFYLPNLFKQFSNLTNMIIKDLIMIAVVVLIYYKDVSKDWKKFKRSKNKWTVILWSLAILALSVLISRLIKRYLPSIREVGIVSNINSINKYYKISKIYAFFKVVLFVGIVESILFSLSFRKVFNNNVIFIIVSALIYTYFNYVFTGLNLKYLLNPLVIRFIPYCLCNFAYVKNNNNIASLMVIVIIRNAISFTIFILR